ncbi:RNA polymerase I associated factor, A49-like protein [Mrakia frigida]|uniref:DNA-directed RNA polymerase I subunit RPA49 n=1 Tax=Mrakia frigida TaxID=29902 RepID=UPI003FCC02E2
MSTSATPVSSQKRKSTASSSSSSKKVQVSFDPSASSSSGPLLANFPSIQAPTNVPFKLYRDRKTDESKPFEEQLTLLAGETNGVEFFSTNRDNEPDVGEPVGGYPCRYLLGVHDPSTNTLTLAPTPAYLLSHSVKRLKDLKPMENPDEENANRIEARNKLGEAFGTKKSKSRIKTAERNKIDTAGMEGMRNQLEESILVAGKDLPSQETIKQVADDARPIPPPNMAAETPSEAYSLASIISPAVTASLKPFIKELLEAEEDKDRITMLPFKHSEWVKRRVRNLCTMEKPSKEKMRILVYISAIRMFQKSRNAFGDATELAAKMGGRMPKPLIDSLLAHFTETPRGTTKPLMTPFTETKLYSYMFVLCLMVDNFVVDLNDLAKELNMEPTKARAIFVSLGCKIDTPNAEERDRLGLNFAEAKATKKAILKVPLEFKGPSRGAPKR